MQRSSRMRSNPEIERIVSDLLAADANFDRVENRSVHRDHLVRPVQLHLRSQETEQTIGAFSRNISDVGIGIITEQEIRSGEFAVIEIERFNGEPAKIISECRWSKNYCGNWFISGWQFQNVKRGK